MCDPDNPCVLCGMGYFVAYDKSGVHSNGKGLYVRNDTGFRSTSVGEKINMRCLLLLLLLSSCCCSYADDAPVITLPDMLVPIPCPEPQQPSAPVLTPETLYVVQSTVPLIALQSPEGLLKLTADSGPLRVRGRFADGDGKIETRSYSAKYLLFVDGIKPGTTELILIPQGVTAEKDIVRQVLTVSGEGPRPPPEPPGPGPEPKPPEPVKSFRVIFVKESGQTLNSEQSAIPGAKAIRDYVTARTTPEGGLAGWREYDPQQTTTNEQPTMKALWESVKPKLLPSPCLVIEVNGTATVMPFPKDVTEALETLKKAGG